MVTAFIVLAADVAGTILVLIPFVAGDDVGDIIGKILVYISVVVGTILVLMVLVADGCATKVNKRFVRHCEVLFRSHGLERTVMDEFNRIFSINEVTSLSGIQSLHKGYRENALF